MTDPTFRQMDYLAQELDRMEQKMIDPIEYGELRGKVAAMQTQISEIQSQQAATNAKLDQVLAKLSEARGGWKMMMALGGAAATLGGAVTWVAQNVHLES